MSILPIENIAKKLNDGIVKTNLYQVRIALNNSAFVSINNEKTAFSEIIRKQSYPNSVFLLCKNIEMPGLILESAEDTGKFGIHRRYPQNMQLQPLSMDFICSKSMEEKRFFEDWINYIYHREKVTNSILDSDNLFLCSYYEDYVATMYIDILSDTPDTNTKPTSYINDRIYTGEDKILGRTIVYEAYPYNINSIRLSYEAHDEYMTLSVSMQFRYYVFDNNVNN